MINLNFYRAASIEMLDQKIEQSEIIHSAERIEKREFIRNLVNRKCRGMMPMITKLVKKPKMVPSSSLRVMNISQSKQNYKT